MTDRKEENLNKICTFLPPDLSDILLRLQPERKSRLCEIRIRADKPVTLIFTDERLYITKFGRLTSFASNDLMKLTSAQTQVVFNAMCGYSVHSLSHDISEGFVTVDGGNRVGIYGTAVTDGERITSVRSIRGLNIRISGDFAGCADRAAELYNDGRVNVLICGPPSSGKTTVMKDLCRILSDLKGLKVCIVDEREETDGCYTGINTDVLSGYPKAKGVEIAVRTLSPEIIAFDEIGAVGEARAVCDGLNSGVSFIMTMHCSDKSELVNRVQFRRLMSCNAVDYCVFVRNVGEISEIVSVEALRNENSGIDDTGNCLRAVGSIHSLRA